MLILHITKRLQWEQAKAAGSYRGDTLDSEGFIHCSTPNQVLLVANRLFRAQKGLVLLCIEKEKVQAEIRFEGPVGGMQFPHIYGPLNLDAVVKVLDFIPGSDGKFKLPRIIDLLLRHYEENVLSPELKEGIEELLTEDRELLKRLYKA